MLAALRHRDFALLWCGGLISMMGDWVLLIGLSAYVYQLTGSTLATGIALIVQMAPGILLGSIAGVFTDWWDRRRTMVIGNLLQALTLIPLLIVHARQDVWVVYLVGLVGASIGRFVGPAESALLPQLVGEAHLVAANSLNTLNKNLARLIGPAAGGAIVALSGLAGVVILDVGSFLAAAIMVWFVRTRQRRSEAGLAVRQAIPATWTRVWRDWWEGLLLVKDSRVVLGLFLVGAAAALADAVAGPLWVAFVYKVLHKGAVEYGWLSPAQGVGGIVGSFLLVRVAARISLPRLIAGSAAVIGFIELGIFNVASLPLTLALLPVSGVAVVGVYTGLFTELQTSVEDRYRGRIFGAYDTSGALLSVVGMGAAGALGSVIGIAPLLNAAACLYLMCGAIAWVVLGRHGS